MVVSNMYQHESGVGVVLEFKDIPGDEPVGTIVVCNAKLRVLRKWGTYGKEISKHIVKDCAENVLFKILKQYTSYTDSLGLKGIPAINYAESIVVDNEACVLPTTKDLDVLCLYADEIDRLDPTVIDYPQCALGSHNPHGYWGCMGTHIALSRTELDSKHVLGVHCYADLIECSKAVPLFVIPIRRYACCSK